MKRSFIFLLLCLFTTFLFAKEPVWYENLKSVYPDAQYISNIGYGKNKDEASADALNGISRFFSTKVSTSVEAREEMRVMNGQTDIKRELDAKTVVESQMELFAVEYSKPYFDKKTKQTAIVAYIDRAKAWRVYREKLDSYASSFMKEYQLASSQTDKLKQYFLFKSAKTKAVDFVVPYETGLLLNYAECKASYYEINEKVNSLSAIIKDLKMECTMNVVVKNDNSNTIQRTISSLLSGEGFAVQKEKAPYQVLVECIWDVVVAKDSYGETFTSYPGIEVVIQNSGNAIFSYSKTCGKTVAFDRNKNVVMSYQKLEKELNSTFVKEFNLAF